MHIVVSNASSDPIYQQIADQIRIHIIDGTLQPGELLPSIRALARNLQISVITTTRVYSELEKEGLIDSVAGKGFFVAPQNPQLLKERQLRVVEDHLEQAVAAARGYGIPKEKLSELIDLLYEEEI